jgi:hypothetical protein
MAKRQISVGVHERVPQQFYQPFTLRVACGVFAAPWFDLAAEPHQLLPGVTDMARGVIRSNDRSAWGLDLGLQGRLGELRFGFFPQGTLKTDCPDFGCRSPARRANAVVSRYDLRQEGWMGRCSSFDQLDQVIIPPPGVSCAGARRALSTDAAYGGDDDYKQGGADLH